jgi:tRNA A-37 threonylcarbamoyl transferase component Bud32
MIECPKCSAENLPESRFCSSCGQELSSLSQAPTVATPEGEAAPSPAQSPHVGRIVSSDSVPAGGFTPGTILADRYRVIGLLGRGGMGEVYRADDLKLGQPVALKFLPPKLSEDPVRRERFFAEVRITRQLSHPNICRVYDIGEVDGRHFLSMEYIDGEDLASLMKRIGHLSNEKALDIARQLVAGLSVAHERGVLHRDLKPANIMLDGHGRVRITDFGLAIAVGDKTQAEEIAGTPAYMAPEQLAGKGATVRSDIYSLGLILYEIYTGKKAFTAKTLAELRERKETQTPRAPSEIREGIDPVVERVIQRCMEKDPGSRPASVAQLAAALPGGDPLAAAIAAGETPSPEMVAASGSKEGLRPAVAWTLLAAIILGWLAIIAMNDRFTLYRYIPFENRPEYLAGQARQFIEKAGCSEKSKDSYYSFIENSNLLDSIEESDKKSDRWKSLDARAILFMYRQSPRRLIFEITGLPINNPPLQFPGEALVVTDTEGRLVLFRCVPSPLQSSSEVPREPDWTAFFNEAGIDQLIDVSPQRNPPFYADTRKAWQGSFPDKPDESVRIEAAALQEKPVSFEIAGEWPWADISEPSPAGNVFLGLFYLIVVLGGIFFARRNIRLGRGDRRGATRIALFTLALTILAWIPVLPLYNFATFLLQVLIIAGSIWIFYVAIEPFARRRWPRMLVSWTRLLSGEWKDPLVARDALLGATFGTLWVCFSISFIHLIPSWLGFSESTRPSDFNLFSVLGARFFLSELPSPVVYAFVAGFLIICFLYILRILLRNQIAAVIVVTLIIAYGLAAHFQGEVNPWYYAIYLVLAALWVFVLMRFGLVAAMFFIFTHRIFITFPITFDTSAWYAGYGYVTLAILLAIVLYAFYTSLGGRPLFGTPRLDD